MTSGDLKTLTATMTINGIDRTTHSVRLLLLISHQDLGRDSEDLIGVKRERHDPHRTVDCHGNHRFSC